MTESEFFALNPGEHFLREGKEYSVVGVQVRSQVAHPIGDPRLRIHFQPQQACQMTKVEPKPDLRKPKSSHGFPLLERAPMQLPRPHMPSDTTRMIALPVDGGIAQHRNGAEIGPPLPGVLEFLTQAVEREIDILVSTHRPQNLVYQWLRVHCPGAEKVVHVSPGPVPSGAIYLSQFARRITDTYPPMEELLGHEESTPTPVEAVG